MQFLVYKDTAGQYRWRLYATNNRIVADSGEGYHNKQDCLNGVNLVKGTNSATPVHTHSSAQ